MLAVKVAGVTLVGLSADVGVKFGYSLGLIAALWLLRRLAFTVVHLLRRRLNTTARFWSRQAINLATAVLFIFWIISIWFDNPGKFVTGLGFFSAGLAFALQKAVTSIAGYFLILRGNMFTIGDRILMGGVRGDVIGLGFLRTTILEMGQPLDSDQLSDDGDTWVRARQYTGRIITVTNGVVFDEPVFNYSRDFPYLWEEIHLPVKYGPNREAAEQIMLEVAQQYAVGPEDVNAETLQRMRRRYFLPSTEVDARMYLRLTDNWLELTVRFLVPAHGIRELKSEMSRAILERFEEQGIEVASATYDIVGLPPVRVEQAPPRRRTSKQD